MKGYSHAITGAALWTVVAAPKLYLDDLAPHLWHMPLTPGWLEVKPMTYALGLMMCAGAALLPDADHHNGTIAHSLPRVGPIPSPTKALCALIGKISGGHRHGTHSILGIIAFTLIAWLAGLVKVPIFGTEVAIGAGIFAFLLTAFTLKVFKVGKSKAWFERWTISLLFAAVITWWLPNEWNALPFMVALGCLAHMLGDMLTVGGVPWFYPWTPDSPKWVRRTPILRRMWQSNGWFSIPILGKTDSTMDTNALTRENVMCFILTFYIMAVGTMTGFVYIAMR